MRVLHVTPGMSTRTGGPSVAIAESVRALQGAGVECTIVTTDLDATASASSRRPVTPADLPPLDGLDVRFHPARPPRRLAYSPSLGRALRRDAAAYDVVHLHSLYLYPQHAGFRAAVRAGRPYVVSPRGALDPWLRARGRLRKRAIDLAWQRGLLEGAAAIHVTTPEEAELISDLAPQARRIVVPNGVHVDDFAELPPPADYGGAPVVLFLGRLSHKKGLDVLVEAFARLDVPGAVLVVAGPDDEGLAAGLRSLAERLGVGVTVRFVGMLRGPDKLAALAAADVLVLPSSTENFGVSVVEALAAGVPVVVSPAVNLASALHEADAGVVAEATPDATAAGIRRALADAGLPGRGAAFARRYDWSSIAPQLRGLYEAALDG